LPSIKNIHPKSGEVHGPERGSWGGEGSRYPGFPGAGGIDGEALGCQSRNQPHPEKRYFREKK